MSTVTGLMHVKMQIINCDASLVCPVVMKVEDVTE